MRSSEPQYDSAEFHRGFVLGFERVALGLSKKPESNSTQYMLGALAGGKKGLEINVISDYSVWNRNT